MNNKIIKSPIGNKLNCKGWHQEAAFRMLQNNLDPDVAEDASNRVFFEATRLINDTIVPELHAGFSMDPFRVGDLEVSGKKIVLEPENPKYKPITVEKESEGYIWGVVTNVIHNL